MDKRIIKPFVEKFFSSQVLPNLQEFIKIPNCSPNYDPDWEKNGNALKAAEFLANWVNSQNLINCNVALLSDKGHTPFLFIDIKSTKTDDDRSILMYGHMDKQPPFSGWSEGLGPQIPVIKNNLLYGRGGSDDGYAIFAAVTSVKACQDNNWPIPRIIILIEGAEESSTVDLFYYVNELKIIIGDPSLIICLDSCCEDYDRLWVTTSLRGVVTIDLNVAVTSQSVHSGIGGGLIPDSFMIMRQLLDRIEDAETGDIKDKNLLVDLPNERSTQIDEMIKVVGKDYLPRIPWYQDTHPLDVNLKDTIIRNTWKPTLVITGENGIPDSKFSVKAIRTNTELRLSIRIPPLVDSAKAALSVKEILEKDRPYNAKVTADIKSTGDGWNLDSFSERLNNILNIASQRFFANDLCFLGVGGSIPFVQLFDGLFPKSDFAVLGLNGPSSNIHGPDENLNLDFCQKLIMCLTYLISEY
jgi:acetylornithine deacetylase/succinyl-diaminopimelate desuccinylase-like protein